MRAIRCGLAVAILALLGACAKENEVTLSNDGKTTNATCDDLCKVLARGDFGDCDAKGEQYQKDTPACVNECNDHVLKGKASQSGLNCAIDLSKQTGPDRCNKLVHLGECGDFF